VKGSWGKLHNEELHKLYFSPNIVWMVKSRRIRRVGNVTRMGWNRSAQSVLVGKGEGQKPLGRLGLKWEDNIEMDLREIGWGDMDCIRQAQDRNQFRAFVNTAMNFRVP
jgi:hypothetical protein